MAQTIDIITYNEYIPDQQKKIPSFLRGFLQQRNSIRFSLKIKFMYATTHDNYITTDSYIYGSQGYSQEDQARDNNYDDCGSDD